VNGEFYGTADALSGAVVLDKLLDDKEELRNLGWASGTPGNHQAPFLVLWGKRWNYAENQDTER